MATTQQQLAAQMVAQLRVLDPSISAEIGTPERKIIDTVAQALVENQVDLNVLSGAFDIDGKFGTDLDNFLAIFGFGRQQGSMAVGFVTFSRVSPSTLDITIPQGTQVFAPNTSTTIDSTSLIFVTTSDTILTAGQLSVLVPAKSLLTGTFGNVAANAITQFQGAPVAGITSVNNNTPFTGGSDPESDDEFKTRFKNTVFRNLAGTEDQYLALAVSTQFSTKANVVGPISRYREYIQVPTVDDASADPNNGVGGNGAAGEYTSALSTIPYSKHIYDTIPYFVTNGVTGVGAIFYRQDTDFYLNASNSTRDRGDTYRERILATGGNVYTDSTTNFEPNVTLINVYTGADGEVQATRPQDIVLFEHSYMSNASRNDWGRNITNCVDVFINGENPTVADATIPTPAGTTNLFSGNVTNRYYYDNFRRIGEPQHRPLIGNIYTPLFWQPITDLPDTITIGTVTYVKGFHYWPIEDKTNLGGTIRSRNGIEWSTGVFGRLDGDSDPLTPNDALLYTGAKITANIVHTATISSYTYDKNVIDLQASLDGNKQVATDILAHRGTRRYFKLDITVMYDRGATASAVNLDIGDNVSNFFDGLYFGTTIQLSDLLQVIHNTSGVDNVRWSREILEAEKNVGIIPVAADVTGNPRNRIVECDNLGNPLLNIIVDRLQQGTGTLPEIQQFYIVGSPTGGTYQLTHNALTTAAIAYNANAATVLTALTAASIPASTVTGAGTSANPFVVTFASNVARPLLIDNAIPLLGGTAIFNTDFFLQDNELPFLPLSALSTDSQPGLIIRPRAQNTWSQL